VGHLIGHRIGRVEADDQQNDPDDQCDDSKDSWRTHGISSKKKDTAIVAVKTRRQGHKPAGSIQ
jgi:hypothetical protein